MLFSFSQGVIFLILMLKFRPFTLIKFKISTWMEADVFHFHQTKLIHPCQAFMAIQRSVLKKKMLFQFSQGIIFLIFMLKFRPFTLIKFKFSTWIVADVFHFHQTKLICLCKALPSMQMCVLKRKMLFLFSQGVIFMILMLKFLIFTLIKFKISTCIVANLFDFHQNKLICPYKTFMAIQRRVLKEKCYFRFLRGSDFRPIQVILGVLQGLNGVTKQSDTLQTSIFNIIIEFSALETSHTPKLKSKQ